MKVLKRIGFSVLNLILTFFYFGILLLMLFFSVAPDNYGSQDSFLIEDQNLEMVIIPVFLIVLGITQYLTFWIKPDKILEALYAELRVLKWLTLVWAILGAISTWWFYHSSNFIGYLAILFWCGVYMLVFLIVSRITRRVWRKIDKKKNELKWDHLIDKLSK